MDIRVLKYFLAIAQEGNITKAAQSLHITQPTLSRQMMELEEEMGAGLFVRGKRQVQLTDSGILFLQRAREILRLYEKTKRELAECNDLVGTTVSIACVESVASHLLPQALQEFTSQYPMVKYELYSGDGNDIREKIDRGDIDMGILLEPVEAAKYDYLRLPFYEQWGIVMKKEDPLANRKTLTTQEIQGLPLIVPRRTIVIEEIAKWLEVDSDRLNIVVSHNLLTNSLLLVESGIGYTICVKGSYEIRKTENICFIPFEPKRTTGHVLAWKKNHTFSPATERFLHYMKNKYPHTN